MPTLPQTHTTDDQHTHTSRVMRPCPRLRTAMPICRSRTCALRSLTRLCTTADMRHVERSNHLIMLLLNVRRREGTLGFPQDAYAAVACCVCGSRHITAEGPSVSRSPIWQCQEAAAPSLHRGHTRRRRREQQLRPRWCPDPKRESGHVRPSHPA